MLHAAMDIESINIVKILLAHDLKLDLATPNFRGETVLHVAVGKSEHDILKELLRFEASARVLDMMAELR